MKLLDISQYKNFTVSIRYLKKSWFGIIIRISKVPVRKGVSPRPVWEALTVREKISHTLLPQSATYLELWFICFSFCIMGMSSWLCSRDSSEVLFLASSASVGLADPFFSWTDPGLPSVCLPRGVLTSALWQRDCLRL